MRPPPPSDLTGKHLAIQIAFHAMQSKYHYTKHLNTKIQSAKISFNFLLIAAQTNYNTWLLHILH